MHKSRTFVAHVDPSHQKRHRGTRQTDRKSHRRDQNRSRGDRFVELFDLYPSSGTNPKLHHRGKIRAENFPHFFILYFIFLEEKILLQTAKNFFRFLLLFFSTEIITTTTTTNVSHSEEDRHGRGGSSPGKPVFEHEGLLRDPRPAERLHDGRREAQIQIARAKIAPR